MSILHPLRDSRGRDPYRDDVCCNGDCNQGRRCPLVPCRIPVVTPEPPHEQRPESVPVAAIVRVLIVAIAALFSTVLYVHFAEHQTQEVPR